MKAFHLHTTFLKKCCHSDNSVKKCSLFMLIIVTLVLGNSTTVEKHQILGFRLFCNETLELILSLLARHSNTLLLQQNVILSNQINYYRLKRVTYRNSDIIKCGSYLFWSLLKALRVYVGDGVLCSIVMLYCHYYNISFIKSGTTTLQII